MKRISPRSGPGKLGGAVLAAAFACMSCLPWALGTENPGQTGATTGGGGVGEVVQGPPIVSTGLIQGAVLDPSQPLFVPTHPRVTTTLRFPGPIGAPEGRGFTEDESKAPGEYLVAWTRGDPHLTVTPLPGAAALNLNIPYRGDTYVVYFYPVERQFQALASLRLLEAGEATPPPQRAAVKAAQKPGPRKDAVPTASLLGLIDKLKLLRAVAPGKGQRSLAKTMGVELHCPQAETKTPTVGASDAEGGLQIEASHVVRDPSLGALAFVLRLRNGSGQAETLSGAEFSVLCGSSELYGRLTEAPLILLSGEEAEAFLVVREDPLCPLKAENHWTVKWSRAKAGTAGGTAGTGEDEIVVEVGPGTVRENGEKPGTQP